MMTLGNVIDETPFVDELRQRLKGGMSEKLFAEDSLFQRFIRARNYNLDAAEKMLRSHLQWRKEGNIDTFLETYKAPELLRKYFTANLIGFDREHCPIMYLNVGELDTRGLLKCFRKVDAHHFIIHLLEKTVKSMELQSMKHKTLISQFVIIFNFKNLNILEATHKETLEVAAQLIKMFENNYPERLKTAYMINASYLFTLVFAVIRPFITGKTFEKIQIYGKNNWEEALLKCIHPDVLPAFLGGKRTDPDGNPLCKTIITHGGLVPKELYVYRSDRENSAFSKMPGVRRLSVGRMSKQDIRMEVTDPGTTIEWEFETKDRDIAFTLLFLDPEDGYPKEVVPKQRFDTAFSSEAGIYLCAERGTYIIQFDNTYSWINSKEVFCKTSIVTPGSHED